MVYRVGDVDPGNRRNLLAELAAVEHLSDIRAEQKGDDIVVWVEKGVMRHVRRFFGRNDADVLAIALQTFLDTHASHFEADDLNDLETLRLKMTLLGEPGRGLAERVKGIMAKIRLRKKFVDLSPGVISALDAVIDGTATYEQAVAALRQIPLGDLLGLADDFEQFAWIVEDASIWTQNQHFEALLVQVNQGDAAAVQILADLIRDIGGPHPTLASKLVMNIFGSWNMNPAAVNQLRKKIQSPRVASL